MRSGLPGVYSGRMDNERPRLTPLAGAVTGLIGLGMVLGTILVCVWLVTR